MLGCQELEAALVKFAQVGLQQWKNWMDKTPTKKSNLMHVGMYFITLVLLLLFLIMCRYERGQGRNLGSLFLTNNGRLQYLDRFP